MNDAASWFPPAETKEEQVELAWLFHSRRLTRRGGMLDDTLRLRLAGEQNWRCCYCGGEMAMSRRESERRYATFEHIVPLSRGGTNGLDNVAIACRDCNVRRGNAIWPEHIEAVRVVKAWRTE